MGPTRLLLSVFLISQGICRFASSELSTSQNLDFASSESEVIFYLYTRGSTQPEILLLNDVATLEKSRFNKSKATIFLIHGWLDNVNRPFAQGVKQNLLETEDVNVIVVDWGKIAKNIFYTAVVNSVPRVGQYLAKFLDFLVEQGSDSKSFYLIGHSLGAHVAGFAGKNVRSQKPARITGLDIARPSFEWRELTMKLAPSDADFVDCIHTSGGLQGFYEPQCHADFYANGGVSPQPGCHFYDFGSCSHKRAFALFGESVLKGHTFPTEKCEWKQKPVNCKPSEVNMGYYVERSVRGVYYLKTNDKAPFSPIHP